MPLVSTRGGASAFGLGWSAAGAGEELSGMVLLTPTSIAYTGTSATVGANGSVTYSACTSLSLNGVFSADYDNYMMSISSIGSGNLIARMRASGTDNTASSVYTSQTLGANNTTVSAERVTVDNYAYFGYAQTSYPNGNQAFIYGPYLAQPTAGRTVNTNSGSGARIEERVWTHGVSTAYDGITLTVQSGTISGVLSVYGLVGA